VDIPFVEPDDIPVPPPEVRFREVKVAPHPDRRRVRVRLELTPFLERPDINLLVQDAQGGPLASAAIVETNEASLQLTLHLPAIMPAGLLTLVSTIHYTDHGLVDRRETNFETA
jgi:hypothetical protein